MSNFNLPNYQINLNYIIIILFINTYLQLLKTIIFYKHYLIDFRMNILNKRSKLKVLMVIINYFDFLLLYSVKYLCYNILTIISDFYGLYHTLIYKNCVEKKLNRYFGL